MYFPRTHPFGAEAARARTNRGNKDLSDEEMRRAFEPGMWRTCTGAANTMILADTIGYHRGGKPMSGTRTLVTFTYTSRTPLMPSKLHIASAPAWASAPIQQFAIRDLVRRFIEE